MRKDTTLILAMLGFAGGVVVGLLLPTLLMMWSEARTGYDSGNGGILFCCTLPTFPIIGIAIGLAIGYRLEKKSNQ